MEQFSHFTKRLYHEAAGGLNTVVHCRAGIGRTGIVAVGVLFHCGFEPIEAFEHISNKRGVSVPDTQEQIDWVKENYGAIVNTYQINQLRAFGAGRSKAAPVIEAIQLQ